MRLILLITIALCLVEFNFARTITQHHETIIHSNGDKTTKTWTSKSSDEQEIVPSMLPSGVSTLNIKPRMETSSIGGPNIPTEELLKHESLTRGMDPIAINELLKNKQPVVQTEIDDKGRTRTSTYRLNPDGSISKHSVIESQRLMMNRNNFDVETVPIEEILKLDQPVSKTYRDGDGNIVRKTYKVPTTTLMDPPKPLLPSSSNNNKPHDEAKPQEHDILERRHKPRERDEDDAPTVIYPESWKPNNRPNIDNTDTQSNEKPFTFNFNTNDFSGIDTRTPGTYTKTSVDDQGRTIKTTYTIGPTTFTRKTFHFPVSSWPDTTSTIKTTTQLPSLEDFLRSQYETTAANNDGDLKRTTTITTTPRTIQRPTTTTVRTAVDSVENSQTTTKTFIVGKIPTDFDTESATDPEVNTPNVQSRINTYSTTIQTSEMPTLNDLEPKIRDILIKAGITDEDLKNSNGESITKTRTEPNGAIVKTTFRLKTIQSPVADDDAPNSFGDRTDERKTTTTTLFTPRTSLFNDRKDDFPTLKYPVFTKSFPDYELTPLAPFKPKRSLIDEFLAKINLSVNDILAKNGQLIKTITEDNGRVLTATFVLSDVIGDTDKKKERYISESAMKPLK